MSPKDIDLVYIATDWDHHFPVAVDALTHDKHVAIEVPSAMNLEQCWTLINLSERTRKHCMILENCCYDWFEMNTLNMAQHGVFGEILRVQGAYIHNLDDFWPYYWKNGKDDKLGWRLRYNKENRGDLYPTHGLARGTTARPAPGRPHGHPRSHGHKSRPRPGTGGKSYGRTLRLVP